MLIMKLRKIKLIALILPLLVVACHSEDDYTPKPKGYFRIGLPEKEYQQLHIDCPYTFEYNRAAEWQKVENPCWGDIYYPSLKARLQLTYKNVTAANLDTLLDDSRRLAFEHQVMADGISEKVYTNPQRKVYGIVYKIMGEAATNCQFFMTDSTRHYLRGVLYFYAEPNEDSLQPVNQFMYNEVVHLVNTLQWQSSSP